MKQIRKSFIRYLTLTWPAQYKARSSRFDGLKPSPKSLLTNSIEFEKDLDAGRECIYYATKCNWWEWPGGSRLFFWRWPLEFRIHARDRIPICWLPNKQPNSKKPQPLIHDKIVKEQMSSKINKVRKRGYVTVGRVRSLIHYFAVPKGNSDIHMVYDGTASGFNDTVYIQNFGLPTIETLLRRTGP